MKARMYSQQKHSLLHDHILDGFAASHEGLHQLLEKKLIKKEEYTRLLEANVKRLIERVREFRITEKITCMVFACLFSYIQVNGDDLDMRRCSRARGRARTENGRRRE